MRLTKSVWKSNSILQVFLSACSKKGTEKNISQDTGFSQPVVHQYLSQLYENSLIIKNGVTRYTYAPNSKPIVSKCIFPRDDNFVKTQVGKKFYDFLVPTCDRFLYLLSLFPLWRNDTFINNEYDDIPPTYEEATGYTEEVVRHIRRVTKNLQYNPPKYIKTVYGREAQFANVRKNGKYGKLTLNDVAITFLEYLTINRSLFTNIEKNIIDRYISFYFKTIEGDMYLNERIMGNIS